MDKSKENNNSSKLMAMAVTASMLLGGSGYLYYDNVQIKNLNEQNKIELSALDKIKLKLQTEVDQMKLELEDYKGKNKSLDKLVASANKEIKLKEHKIKKLISDNSSLKKIQKEVYELRRLKQKYLTRIQELEEKVMNLSRENMGLKQSNSKLQDQLSELEERNQFLERKVSIASVLRVENVLVLGEKKLKNDKFTKSKLRHADRFIVTFDVVENKVAESGEKAIYIRVTDPKGNLITNAESGNFVNADENMETPYTQKFLVNYNNDKQRITFPVVLSGNELEKGNYVVEFFCEGHFCGLKKLKLK